MSGDNSDDLVDRAFEWGHWYLGKGIQFASGAGKGARDTVERIVRKVGDGVSDSELSLGTVNPPVASERMISRFNITGNGRLSRFLPGIGPHVQRHWGLTMGVSLMTVVLCNKLYHYLQVPEKLGPGERNAILVFGDMNDPMIRSQIMDLYRRRYVVFICSENVQNLKNYEEETQSLRFINPLHQRDLEAFSEFFQKDENYSLDSILFIPNLSYHSPGELSVDSLQYEIRTNILIHYNTLIKLLPHLPRANKNNRKTQLILFNPSLSYNLETCHHAAETFVSGFITSIYKSLRNYETLNVFMINLGLFQIRGQLSNYKYLRFKGCDIHEYLHEPIYHIIRNYNGNRGQRLSQWIRTLGGNFQVYYMGKYSLLSTLAIFPIVSQFKSLLNVMKKHLFKISL